MVRGRANRSGLTVQPAFGASEHPPFPMSRFMGDACLRAAFCCTDSKDSRPVFASVPRSARRQASRRLRHVFRGSLDRQAAAPGSVPWNRHRLGTARRCRDRRRRAGQAMDRRFRHGERSIPSWELGGRERIAWCGHAPTCIALAHRQPPSVNRSHCGRSGRRSARPGTGSARAAGCRPGSRCWP